MSSDTLQVVRRTAENKYGRFQQSDKNPFSAANRLSQREYVPVHVNPKFTLSKADAAFTIGSCFARNVEYKLARLGVNVLTSDFRLAGEYYANSTEKTPDHRGVLNKYNPHSMRTEVLRSLGEISDLPDEGFIKIGEDKWIDPQASSIAPNTLDEIRYVRSVLNEVNGRIRKASIVFVTLGLTETWYDRVTGLSLNQAPSMQIVRRTPERFYFKNADWSETVSNLKDIVEAISRSNAETKIVLTVSPVPLNTTFSGDDVISANAYSKATLLAAARAVAREYANVDYFPSYEMVTSTPRELAFQEDGIHVINGMVGFVMDRFAETYFA